MLATTITGVALALNDTFAPVANSPTGTSPTPEATPQESGTPPPSEADKHQQSPPPAPKGGGDASQAQLLLQKMTLEQKAGQVLMASMPVTGASESDRVALKNHHIGNVFLKGRTEQGAAAVAQVSQNLGTTVKQASNGIKPLTAIDQEGGYVQTLKGPGTSPIPQAIEQATGPAKALETKATQWGRELKQAGVNMNLAPVLDTVPSAAFAPQNAPIGYYGRQYGYDPATVSEYGLAVAHGFRAGGVAPTVKHFPGLGRVTGNTDVARDVTDTQTTRNGPYLKPFRDAINTGVEWVMVSNARYSAIDPHHIAPMSSVVMEQMLRGDLGFTGGIISDDLCDAVQLSDIPLQDRGSGFLAAGGTMALCTKPGASPAVHAGIVKRAQSDPEFAKKLDTAVLTVLEIKKRAGLL